MKTVQLQSVGAGASTDGNAKFADGGKKKKNAVYGLLEICGKLTWETEVN